MIKLTSRPGLIAWVMLAIILSGCSKMTRFEAPPTGGRLELLGHANDELPRSERLRSRSTGQQMFHAVDGSGAEMYGILPLRINGGTMALSIALFAPALFIGGFRDVFPYYEIDPAAKVIRYRGKESEEWRTYVPINAEGDRAKEAFEKAGK